MDTITDKFGLKWVLKPDWDNDIVRCVGQGGVYEGGMFKFVREVYPKLDADFFDIGAAFGYFTVHASKVAPETRTVYAFEPHPDHYTSLQQNIFYNDCKNAIAMNIALFDRVDELEVNNFKRDAGVCLNETTGDYPKVKVKTQLLSVYEQNVPRVLKMDTEMTEFDILLGSPDFVRSDLTRAIAIEFVAQTNYRLNIYNFLKPYFPYIYVLDEDCGKIIIPSTFREFLPQDILLPTPMNVVFMKEQMP